MTALDTESAVLERLKASLVAEGYEVIIQPSALQLPSSLADLRPDAIALRKDENLVIEVMSRSSSSQQKLRKFTAVISEVEGWTLRTVWTSGHSVPARMKPPSKSSVEEIISSIDNLIQFTEYGAAMLLCWAALEGIARRILKDSVGRPQTPRRLIEQLAQIGLLKTNDARFLREMSEFRNRLIHGDFTVSISKTEIEQFRSIVNQLSKQ